MLEARPVVVPSSPAESRLAELGMRYLAVVPDGWDGESTLVAVHGISRNWREHAEEFVGHTARRRLALVVPRFSKRGYRGYQRLEAGGRGIQADRALLAVLADFRRRHGAPRLTVGLFGFSGGAQFAHRFALAHPLAVGRLALAAAGFYTFPDANVPFPYGLAARGAAPALGVAGFDLPMRVYVGSLDTERDADLRRSRELDRRQGRDRVERARRFVVAVRAALAMRGRPPACGFEVLPGCGHSFDECVAVGDLARRATDFLFPTPDGRRRLAAPGHRASTPGVPGEGR